MIEDWLASIEALELPTEFSVHILDLGFSPNDKSASEQRGATLVAPEWFVDFPGDDSAPNHFRAMTAKPFLPQCFPDYDVYIWIDADA